jgi:hypothetical protein
MRKLMEDVAAFITLVGLGAVVLMWGAIAQAIAG